jgi:hypothetical protein
MRKSNRPERYDPYDLSNVDAINKNLKKSMRKSRDPEAYEARQWQSELETPIETDEYGCTCPQTWKQLIEMVKSRPDFAGMNTRGCL